MAGRSFQFTVNGGSTVTVAAGRCSGAIQLAAGNNVVAELQSSPATDVTAITVHPAIWVVGSPNLPGRSVTLNAGASTSTGLVTFTDQPAGGNFGTLKICKLTTTPGFIGSLFNFQTSTVTLDAQGNPVSYGPLSPPVSTPANDAFGDPAQWSCTILGDFQVGSNVRVHEQIPNGIMVQFIDTNPGTALGFFDTNAGDAVVTVGAGVTEVEFDNEPAPTNQTGFLEVCKAPALLNGVPDPAVTGPFTFNVVDSNGARTTVTVNMPSPSDGRTHCSQPIPVAAGIATVTEVANPAFTLDDIFTNPPGALVGSNINNGTATVDVPVSASPQNEVQVVFVNEHARTQLKVCKNLGPNSSDLASMTFSFTLTDVTDPTSPVVLTNNLLVPAGQCTIFGNVTNGSTINVTENLDRTVAPGMFIDTSGEGPITIQPGTTNIATITNTARGNLEICKRLIDPWTTTAPVFQFRVDGGPIQNVTAGVSPAGFNSQFRCVTLRVSPGQHTVTELNSTNFELAAIDVTPPGAVVSSSVATRSVTVNVPFAGDVSTFFTNRIRRATVKICKWIPLTSFDSLNGKPFTYNVYATGFADTPAPFTVTTFAAVTGTNSGTNCAFVSNAFGLPQEFPVIQANGTRTRIAIFEQGANNNNPPGPPPGFYIDSITVSGRFTGTPNDFATNCQPFAGSPTGQICLSFGAPGPPIHVRFNPGPGVNEVDFTNVSIDGP